MGRRLKIIRKAVLIGDHAVGKTSLVRKYVLDVFDDRYIATIGAKVTKKSLQVPYGKESVDLTLMLWDVLGQKGFQRTQARAFRGVNGALCVADITRPETLASLEDYWVPLLLRTTGPIPLIFFANKVDLEDEVSFGMREVLKLEERYRLSDASGSYPQSFLTSAKSGAGVDDGFRSLAHYILYSPPGEHDERVVLTDRMEYSFGSPKEALDAMIVDFINRFYYEVTASNIVQDAAARVGLDVAEPDPHALQAFIEELANIERSYGRPEQMVLAGIRRRVRMLESIRG